MPTVLLTKLEIHNFGPIREDIVSFEPFTYFVGRNNAGKSHYLRAIEVLLAPKSPPKTEYAKIQNDKSKEVRIVGHFTGVEGFTSLVAASNHKTAIEDAIKDGVLQVVRVLDPADDDNSGLGILKKDGDIHNPGGLAANLLKVLPEAVSIPATADTVDELKNTQNTALGKLKKEVMASFFEELKVKTKETIVTLDKFLHGPDGERSTALVRFEERLKEELLGEFANVKPSVEFGLPDEEVIAKEMKILLDDGYKSEVEQKGHGLQRATLLALLKVLAKHGARYQDRPSPIFLIGELESFLHPHAQIELASVLQTLVDQYQVVTSTHSPFIVNAQAIAGYRRVQKNNSDGSKAIALTKDSIDISLLQRHLERRGNLEGLFADRIILMEGTHDEGCFERLLTIFDLHPPANTYTIFVKAGGKDELRQSRKFYQQMQFEDVSIICDLDYIFSNDFRHITKELGLDEKKFEALRTHINWVDRGDPPLKYVVDKIAEKGKPGELDELLKELRKHRIFVLHDGAPEHYYKNANGSKSGWMEINSEDDLLHSSYLKEFLGEVVGVKHNTAAAKPVAEGVVAVR